MEQYKEYPIIQVDGGFVMVDKVDKNNYLIIKQFKYE